MINFLDRFTAFTERWWLEFMLANTLLAGIYLGQGDGWFLMNGIIAIGMYLGRHIARKNLEARERA